MRQSLKSKYIDEKYIAKVEFIIECKRICWEKKGIKTKKFKTSIERNQGEGTKLRPIN